MPGGGGSLGLKPSLFCVCGGGGGHERRKRRPSLHPTQSAPPPWPRLPAPAPPPAPPPPHPWLRLHPRPASGRGPFLPQLVLCGRGAARRRLYGRGSERKGEKGRECGRWRGLGRGAEARPGLPHVHSTLQAGPGLFHRQVSRSRIKALEGRGPGLGPCWAQTRHRGVGDRRGAGTRVANSVPWDLGHVSWRPAGSKESLSSSCSVETD